MHQNTRLVVHTRFADRFEKYGKKLWLDPDWINYRIHVYQQLTLTSLRRQTFGDFDILLQCHEDARPLMRRYTAQLRREGVQVIYDEGQEYFENLHERYNHLILVRIDSDDMYAPEALMSMRKSLRKHDAVQCVNGFWWKVSSGKIRRWLKASPPFYAIKVPRVSVCTFNDVFVKLSKHGHSSFRKAYSPIILSSGLFMVVAHEHNLTGGHGFGNQLLAPHNVLPRFGISRKMWNNRRICVPPRIIVAA